DAPILQCLHRLAEGLRQSARQHAEIFIPVGRDQTVPEGGIRGIRFPLAAGTEEVGHPLSGRNRLATVRLEHSQYLLFQVCRSPRSSAMLKKFKQPLSLPPFVRNQALDGIFEVVAKSRRL